MKSPYYNLESEGDLMMVVERKFVGRQNLENLLIEVLKVGLQCPKRCGIVGDTDTNNTAKENDYDRNLCEVKPG